MVAGGERRGLRRGPARADHRDLDRRPSPASAASAAPITGAPCSGVNRPKKTARSGPSAAPAPGADGEPRVRRRRRARRAPGRGARRAARRGAPRCRRRRRRRVRSAAASRRRSSRCRTPPLTPPVGGGVAGADQVVEDDRHVREQPAGQQHVEVAEVADDHRVRPAAVPAPARGRPDATSGRPSSAPAGQASSGSVQGRRSIDDPGGRRQAERRVALPHRRAVGRAGRRAGRRPGGAPRRRRCRRTGGASRATLTSRPVARSSSPGGREPARTRHRAGVGPIVGRCRPTSPTRPSQSCAAARPSCWPSPGVAGLPAGSRPPPRLPAVGRCGDAGGHGRGRRRLPRRWLGPRPGHEPVRRAGRGPARLLGRADPHPLLRGHRGGHPADAGRVRLRMLDNGYRVDVQAVQGTLDCGCCPAASPGHRDAGAERPRATPASPLPHRHPDAHRAAVPAGPAAGGALAAAARRRDAPPFVALTTSASCPQADLAGGSAAVPLRLQRVRLGRPPHDVARCSVYLERWVRWDWTRFAVDGTLLDAVQRIGTTTPGRDGQVPVGHRRGPVVVPGRGTAGAGDRGAHLRHQAGRPDPDADPCRPELDRLEEGDRGHQRGVRTAVEGSRRRHQRAGGRRHRDRRTGGRALLFVDGRPHRGRALRLGCRLDRCARSTTRPGTQRRATRPRSGRGRPASRGRRWLRASGSPASAPCRCRLAGTPPAPPA